MKKRPRPDAARVGAGAGAGTAPAAALDGRALAASTPAVCGRSIELEKSYVRLSALPDPSRVRPPRVLAEALEVVRRRWAQDGDYTYACSQLKAIRQDMTVQMLFDDLAADVYETHARIAIEADDLGEFNACQAQLQPLHAAGHHAVHAAEFCAYRILYNSVVPARGATSQLVLALLQQLNARALSHPTIAQALAAHLAIESADFAAFFRLWPAMHNLGRCFLDRLAPEMRRLGLRAAAVAFEPSVPLERLARLLAFADAGACLAYLRRFHAVGAEHLTRRAVDGAAAAGQPPAAAAPLDLDAIAAGAAPGAAGLELATRAFRQRQR